MKFFPDQDPRSKLGSVSESFKDIYSIIFWKIVYNLMLYFDNSLVLTKNITNSINCLNYVAKNVKSVMVVFFGFKVTGKLV